MRTPARASRRRSSTASASCAASPGRPDSPSLGSTRSAPTQRSVYFMSSSQGYTKPVGSGLCIFLSWRRKPIEGSPEAARFLLLSYWQLGVHCTPSQAVLSVCGFCYGQAVFILSFMQYPKSEIWGLKLQKSLPHAEKVKVHVQSTPPAIHTRYLPRGQCTKPSSRKLSCLGSQTPKSPRP